MIEAILAATACTCTLAAVYAVLVALSLRARVEQLELERPKFLLEMEGLLAQCDEALDRADAKRKRAEQASKRGRPVEAELPLPAPRMIRGSIMEKLP